MSLSDVARLLLLAALWGGSFLLMRISVGEFGPLALIELRIVFAAVFLLPILFIRDSFSAITQHPLKLTILGFFNSALPFTLIAYSTLYVTAGFAAIINATMPFFTAFIGYLWANDALSREKLAGMLVGLIGVIVLVWDKVSFNASLTDLSAVVAGLAAAASYGIAVIYTKVKLTAIKPLALATGSQTMAAILLLPLAVIFWPTTMPSTQGWLSVIALGIFCTGIAYMIFFGLIERIGPTKASTITFLVPAFSVVWGAYFLDEAVSFRMILACLLILGGTAITTGFRLGVKRSNSAEA